ncbi:PHP domain-containing protein [Paenibacillus sp. Marseille-Q4541]|uniref:PHP domain-containing protein n=1 Tax=Paenibacillus sp. Marseille-Q4541 TaxID=2831522 RepID=UPI001BA77102|nr:PHP domain-containing protein [Paenibacillus sp. Marseille-Q4541]
MNTTGKEVSLTGRCDLHTHSLSSDGMQPSSENVRIASEKGLAAVALTDHDTVAGVEEALIAGEKYGITVVPGVEISTRLEGKEIHVLGYYIDIRDREFLTRLETLRRTREERNIRILERLNDLELVVSMEDVVRVMGRPLEKDETIGRPHIADALVDKGYVSSMREAFDLYLAEGKPGFVSVPRVTPEDAFAWIRAAGGTPVIAHPGLYGNDDLIRKLIEHGHPAGIEVYHSDHGPEEEKRYLAMAEQYNLIVTGGSDFHGARQGVVFHGDLGSVTVEASVLSELYQARSVK